MRKILAVALYLSPALLLGAGCSQTSRICSLVCECEHCNDIAENFRCETIEASKEIANIYDCSQEWNDYADCYEQEGECDEDGARFSTREMGNCSSTLDTGVPCVDVNDCFGFASNPSCSNGTCQFPTCNDGSGFECFNDSDCAFGEDRCEDEREDLQECLFDAADDPSFISVDFD